MQEARRKIVSAVLLETDIDENLVEQLKSVHTQLTDESTKAYQREMVVTPSNKFSVNVKDEILGLEVCLS